VSTEQAQKFAGPGQSSYNGSYVASLDYAIGPRLSLGIEAGFGAPAPVVPRWLVGASVTAPLVDRLWGSVSYGYRFYSNAGTSTDVNVMHPCLGFAMSDSLEWVAHYWLAVVHFSDLGGSSQSLHWLNSAGLSLAYRPTTRISLTGMYSYGNQVDLNASIYQVTNYQSHFLSMFFDWFVATQWGWTALYQLEIRNLPSQSIAIHTFELGTYLRW
jgi:YaiO family outer membrane protein